MNKHSINKHKKIRKRIAIKFLYPLLIILTITPRPQLFANTIPNPFEYNITSLDNPTSLSVKTTPASQPSAIQHFTLHYISPLSIQKLINQPHSLWLSENGKLSIDTHSQQLWVRDTPNNIKAITHLINNLDTPTTQVLVKSRIINIDHQYAKELGSELKSISSATTSKSSLQTTGTNSLSIPLVTLNDFNKITLQVDSLLQHGHATLIAKPELFTLNHQAASIESGDEVPYQQATTSGATSVSFKKAVLKLNITPTVLPDKKVLLKVNINQDNVSGLTVNGVPAIRTQQLTTTVLLNNNETVVLGGIFSSSNAKQRQSTPVLQHIPILGRLFTHSGYNYKKKELYVFITPTILNNAPAQQGKDPTIESQ